jgi:ribonuclease P protein component
MELDSLKNAQEFSIVNRYGIKYSGPYFMLICMKSYNTELLKLYKMKAEAKPGIDYSNIISRFKTDNIFLGFKVSKKSGNAVKRNKIRRRIKALTQNIIKTNCCEILKGSGLIFIPRSGVDEVIFAKLNEEFIRSLDYFSRKFKHNKSTVNE